MTRTLIATASAVLAAMPFFASRAEACISCEYVPPVVNSVPAKSYGSERSAPRYEKRTREVVRERSERKKSRVTETERPEKVQKADTPETVEKAPKVVAKAATPAADAEVENSSLALSTKVGERAPAKTETPGDRGTQNSTIATASTSDSSTGSVEANAADKVSTGTGGATCSRYFPTVGQTLRVPCDH